MSTMTDEQLKQYMERRCMCRHPRNHHAHASKAYLKDDLCVVCMSCECKHFTDEIEDEIGDPFRLRERLGLPPL